MLDLDELSGEQSRIDAQKSGGSDFLENFVKMPDKNGYITLRILPPAVASLFATKENPNPSKPKLYIPTRIHKVNGKSVHCPRTLQGEGKSKRWVGDCPVCTLYSHLWKLSDKCAPESEQQKELQAQAREIKPTERYYYNVLVREVREEGQKPVNKESEGPKIWSVGVQIHSMILRAILGDESISEKGLGDITDVLGKTGRDFKVIKTMKTSGNQSFPGYEGSKFLDPTPLGDPEKVAEFLSKLHDLHALRVVKPAEFLEHELKVHQGLEADTQSAGRYDPTEFMRGSVQPSITVTSEKHVDPAPRHETKTPVSNNDPVLESDFMAELKGM